MKKVGKWSRMSGKKKAILLAAVIAGIGFASFGVYSLRGARAGQVAAREMSVQEAQAKIGKISNTIVGTGNLECAEGVSVTIPSGVVVDEVNVESGDSVSKGDVLAVVNEASVLNAMEDIQAEIDALDEEIDDSKDDTDSQSVKAKVAGKIKKIYVQEGQEVSDCMAAQGALMILSMEDYITAEDETDTEIPVTATSGSVEEICVSEGDNVYAGTTLLKIKNDGQSLEYRQQMAKRQELAESLQKLMVLSQSNTITAESDGVVQSVNISAKSSTGQTENAQVSQNAAAIVGSAQNVQDTSEDGKGQESQNTSEDGKDQESQNTPEDGTGQESKDVPKNGKLLTLQVAESGTTNSTVLAVKNPKTGEKPQTSLQAEDGSYEGTISWTPECAKFAAETSYQAYVSLSAGEGYLFGRDSISQIKTGVLSGIDVAEDGKKLSFCITYPFTASEKSDGREGNEENGNNGTNEGTGNNNGNEAGNEIGNEGNGNEAGNEIGNEGNGNNSGNEGNGNNSGNGGGGAAVNASVSANQNGSAAASGASVSASNNESAETVESDNVIIAFTISSSDTMVLSVNVDELDINSVSKDQQAEVTLDAIEGETFTGTVVKVGNTASSSSGGVAKYTVELTVPGDERMKEGMNASAVITVEERENVVTIPVGALQERGNQVFVYTKTDSEGNLSGEQEVTTGLSDGDTVEITEGLSEGDSVYYQKSGNISNQGNSQGFEGGPGGNMGDMPRGDFKGGESGGGMPGGGMPDGTHGGSEMPGSQQ